MRFYGSPEPAPGKIKDLVLPFQNELHLLRHLNEVTPEVKAKFLGQKIRSPQGEQVIDETYLDGLLKTHGAKFHPDQHIDDPQKIRAIALAEAKRREQGLTWYRRGPRRTIFKITLTPELKAEYGLNPNAPLGFGNLLRITDELRPAVYHKERGAAGADAMQRNFIKSQEIPTSDDLIVALVWPDGKENPQIQSAHPGVLTPPLPNPAMHSGEELEYYKSFWQNYAFVESK